MLRKATLQIIAARVSETITFYQDVLGFRLLVTVPPQSDDPIMAMLARDNVDLVVRSQQAVGIDLPALHTADHPEGCTGVILYIEMTDGIDELFTSVKGQAEVLTDLQTTTYGMREFYVRDPNGTILAFAQPA